MCQDKSRSSKIIENKTNQPSTNKTFTEMPRDSALDDLSVLNDPNWKPPSANDIADWSRSAIKILSMSDSLGSDLNNTLADSQRIRSSITLRNSSLENEFQSMDRDLTQQLSFMPDSLQSDAKQRKKNRQKALAERQTRAMLIADGFMSIEEEQEILVDDAALVELGSQRLQQLLAPLPTTNNITNNNNNNININTEGRSPEQEQYNNINEEMEEGNVRSSNKNHSPSIKGKRRRKKRSKRKLNSNSSVTSSLSSPLASSSSSLLASAKLREPSVASNLDASARILAIMEAERKREIFRQETLSSLLQNTTSSSTATTKEYQQMEKLFAREKKQAEKMIASMLSDYVPRPIQKQSPTKQQKSQKKANYKTNKKHGNSNSNGMVAQLRDNMSKRGKQTNFTTTNKMPGQTLEVIPPPIPDGMNIDTVDLDYKRKTNNNGDAVDVGMKDLVANHTDNMDLSFPEIEKYKKPGNEHARYLEKSINM